MNTREYVAQFAGFITGLGFTVYVAEDGKYGFITDDSESRVLSFSGRDGSLSGNYGPPSHESGTGWRLVRGMSELKTAQDVRDALYSSPDYHVGAGWKYFTTVKQHLALYGSSSKYRKVEGGAE